MLDLEHLIARLAAARVEFVVIGGIAAVAHGCTLQTVDLDICCDVSPENLVRIQDAVADLHPVHRLHPRQPPLDLTRESARGWRNLYLKTDLGQLDCLGNVAGVGAYDAAREESIEIEVRGRRCRVLSLDALIRAKEAMGSPRDRETVLLLKAIREHLHED